MALALAAFVLYDVPGIQFRTERINDGAAVGGGDAVNRQAQVALPPLYGPHTSTQVAGDVLPAVEHVRRVGNAGRVHANRTIQWRLADPATATLTKAAFSRRVPEPAKRHLALLFPQETQTPLVISAPC